MSIENESADLNNLDISQQSKNSSEGCSKLNFYSPTSQIRTTNGGIPKIVVPQSVIHKNSFNDSDSSMIISYNQDFQSYRSQVMARE